MVYMIVLEYWFGDINGWGDIGELALNEGPAATLH